MFKEIGKRVNFLVEYKVPIESINFLLEER